MGISVSASSFLKRPDIGRISTAAALLGFSLLHPNFTKAASSCPGCPTFHVGPPEIVFSNVTAFGPSTPNSLPDGPFTAMMQNGNLLGYIFDGVDFYMRAS